MQKINKYSQLSTKKLFNSLQIINDILQFHCTFTIFDLISSTSKCHHSLGLKKLRYEFKILPLVLKVYLLEIVETRTTKTSVAIFKRSGYLEEFNFHQLRISNVPTSLTNGSTIFTQIWFVILLFILVVEFPQPSSFLSCKSEWLKFPRSLQLSSS